MANDVHDQLFDEEKQLYTGDVDDEAAEAEGAVWPVPAAIEPDPTRHPLGTIPVSAVHQTRTSTPKAPAMSRRRRKQLERAQKIIYYLESKYDVLYEVCSSFENSCLPFWT